MTIVELETRDLLPVVPVLFASDLNYLQHTTVCIASLAANNPDVRFDVLVVGTQDFGASSARLLRSFDGNDKISIRLRSFDLPSDMQFPIHFHFTIETYIRFWIGDLLAEYDRALYLDPDIIVAGSIAPLWNTDLEGCTLAAVPIPGSTRPALHGMPEGSLYFNAGVLLFDLKAWRAHDYRAICLKYLNENPEKAIDSDQDILNICLAGDWLPLPFRWNVISAFYFPWHDLQLPPAQVETVRREAQIIHFNGGTKPWSYMSEHPRKADYWKYLRLTGWRDMHPQDYTPLNAVKKILVRPVMKFLRQMVKSKGV
jgi:lipopolysaccharide biosynthesis glycosyltransferase